MRRVTPEMVRAEKLELASLERDWARFEKVRIDKSLRDSLYTRIMELRASVATLEAALRRSAAGQRKLGASALAGETASG
jgi:hypothetical protein